MLFNEGGDMLLSVRGEFFNAVVNGAQNWRCSLIHEESPESILTNFLQEKD
ncbi:Hypothetical protein Bdt_3562 [Bdellovibrio bacteriovorus str. Tiberius]|uniref:Uncharacterized protein n=1 Tax=Bdellovibrio bacteriovorus str. Tiberius TaxID=1069642 RepID=K7ZH89_BDEBC|nr:Hypothetical protein Bdt_3562 [Bdellovibrio bacteriovorus str. Tiberius]